VAAFALWAVAGELIWTAAYVGLGYLFGDSWSGILETVQDSAGLIAGLGLTAVAVPLLIALLRARRPVTAA
jgi:membrane protein DedA with SNARE-associated domain